MTKPKCETCAHFLTTKAGMGLCCARPPVPVYDPDVGRVQSVWPETRPEIWCGEHKPEVSFAVLDGGDGPIAGGNCLLIEKPSGQIVAKGTRADCEAVREKLDPRDPDAPIDL